jgi:hypothetical protein
MRSGRMLDRTGKDAVRATVWTMDDAGGIASLRPRRPSDLTV